MHQNKHPLSAYDEGARDTPHADGVTRNEKFVGKRGTRLCCFIINHRTQIGIIVSLLITRFLGLFFVVVRLVAL